MDPDASRHCLAPACVLGWEYENHELQTTAFSNKTITAEQGFLVLVVCGFIYFKQGLTV